MFSRIIFYSLIATSFVWFFGDQDVLAQSLSQPTHIMDKYVTETGSWWPKLRNMALDIFQICLTIEIVLFGVRMALQQSNVGEIFGQFMTLLLFAAFIYTVITNYEDWAEIVALTGLEDAVYSLTGNSISADAPWEFTKKLWSLSYKVMGNVSVWSDHFISAQLYGVSVLLLIIAFFFLCALLILAKCEFYIVANAGVLLIGLGGSRIFKDYAVNVMRYVLSIGLKVFVIQLIFNLGLAMLDGAINSVLGVMVDGAEAIRWGDLLWLTLQMAVLIVLAMVLPDKCAGLVNGSSIGGGNPLASAAMSVGSLAVGAASSAATGGLSLAASGAGAVRDAYTVAKGQGAGGVGGMAAGMAKAMWDARGEARQAGEQQQLQSHPGSMTKQLRSQANAIKAARKIK